MIHSPSSNSLKSQQKSIEGKHVVVTSPSDGWESVDASDACHHDLYVSYLEHSVDITVVTLSNNVKMDSIKEQDTKDLSKNQDKALNKKVTLNLWMTVFLSLFAITLGKFITIYRNTKLTLVIFRFPSLWSDRSTTWLLG